VQIEVVNDLLNASWSSGIRWIDTAWSYGDGRGYRLLADWMERTGCRPSIIVKPGRPIWNGLPTSRLTWESISREIDQAFAHFGAARAILVKDPPMESFRDGTVAQLIWHLGAEFPDLLMGIASHCQEGCLMIRSRDARSVAQIDYNGINWPVSSRTARVMVRGGWRVWAMQPLAYGFLTQKYHLDTSFSPSDWRSRLPVSARRSLIRAGAEFLSELRRFSRDSTPAALSIAFVLTDAEIERVVVGPKSASQLNDAIIAIDLANDRGFLSAATALRNSIWSTNE
jgi:aryl-alcohol dehydrogenase-like predicted oxidoreductase